jgi:hypothetical protein
MLRDGEQVEAEHGCKEKPLYISTPNGDIEDIVKIICASEECVNKRFKQWESIS